MKTLLLTIIIGISIIAICNFNLSFAQQDGIELGGQRTYHIYDVPLKQVESGILPNNVTCNEGYQLIIKAEDGSPACVRPEHVETLVERGWAEQAFYYHNIHVQPKITLNDYNYAGIDQDSNTTVSVSNQTYYQTTLDYSAYKLPATTSMQFHNVTFSFPGGAFLTPGGAIIIFDIKFPDGYEEIYGNHTANGGSGVLVPTQYGPHVAVNSTTVLSNHMRPQAGITIYHDKIKLLVSTDNSEPPIKQTSDSSSALNLYLSTSSQVIKPGQPIEITISVNNTLSQQVTSSDEDSWKVNYLSVNPCTTEPYGIAILDGFYLEQNLTDGKPLSIFNPDALCPSYNKTTQGYVFEPSSGHVTLNDCTDTPLACSSGFDMGGQFTFSGVWKYGQIQSFNPGLYTIVGGDEWGHLSIEHFVVSNSTIFAGDLGSMSCPMMYGGVQFTASVKNFTGFANYYNSSQYGQTFILHPGMSGTITVQYHAPANAAWFKNNANAPFNMTSGAALFYMENVTEGKSVVSYAVSLYTDETGHHSQICHYGILFSGGFAEPCDTDNTGDIPLSEIPYASKSLHVGIDTLFGPNSVMLYPDSNPVFTAKVYANSNATSGVYWLSLGRSLCGPGVLSKLVVLP